MSTARTLTPFFAAALLLAAAPSQAQSTWQEIDPMAAGLVDGSGKLLGDDGQPLTDAGGNALEPACAFGPFGQPFHFFVQPGDPRRLLVFHDGGGACWEANTCASPFFTADPTYDPRITETPENLALSGGILDDANAANPFKGWTKVFIPYCTGDVGWGNRVATYLTPAAPGGVLQIHHRGYANIRTALAWVQQHYADPATPVRAPAKMALAGVSAGAYATPGTVFPEARKLFPATTRTYVIDDSGNGVVTDAFLASATANWGTANTLPAYLQPVLAAGATALPVRFYGELTRRFPATRFGQYQNAFDGIQTLIYNTMKHADDPALWADPQTLLPSAAEWTVHARLATLLAAAAPNYRFYTAAGTEHVVLVNVPPEANAGFCSDDFYSENSAGGLRFRNWTDAMVNGGGFLWLTGNWRNATCFPNCLVPPKPGCPSLP